MSFLSHLPFSLVNKADTSQKMAQVQASGHSAFASDDGLPDTTAGHDGKGRDVNIDDNTSDDASSEHMQEGVKQAEALTMSWTKKSLGLAYAL